MKISYVIPCYHSDQSLGDVINGIISQQALHKKDTYEIILVNDNPADATWDVICDLAGQHKEITGISMAKNSGQHSALMAGIRQAQGDVVVLLDDDGQTPPDQTYKLIDGLDENTDVVYGDYPEDKFASGFRHLGSSINDWMARWLLHKPKGLYLSSFIAMKSYIAKEITSYTGPFPYVDGLILRSTTQIRNIDVEHKKREHGQSGYSIKKLLQLWLNGFTAFSVKPLRIAAVSGSCFTLIGFILAILVILQKMLLKDSIDAGWSSLMCVLLVIGGLIMMSLGLIGEYLGRIYMSLNNSPQYVIKEIINDNIQNKDSL